jgi:serine/threonine protein kinase/tetratricopeptide (TPR) repeat protein
MDSLELGPFILEHPIGRGGMGEVWLARHHEDGVPVAIKVLTHAAAADPRFVAAFRDEVRAVAGLDHPAIVRVYDYGTVPDPPPADSEGNDLPAGGPYLVMELMQGGTLQEFCGRASWQDTQTLLLGLLDALAHAHARGVIHRDLKPANILIGRSPRDLRLVDFGLAHAVRWQELGLDAPPEGVKGTPAYMAPEQWRGEWRSNGPWTDLYAVGCLGWALTTGEPPFGGKGTPQRFAEAHCYQTPPALRPAIDVPDGFEGWLRHLLDKSTTYRFRRAADAAWALQDLFGPGEAEAGLFETQPATQAVRVAPGPSDSDRWSSAPSHTLAVEPSSRYAAEWTRVRTAWLMERGGSELAPIPTNWRRPVDRTAPRRLSGVGLGLYGLRSIPLVDREPERDLLWAELRRVGAGGRARGVILRGPAGSGKSRLARWIGERAHELGAASVAKALHSPMPGPVVGLGPMMEREFRCVGLSRGDMSHRLSRLVDRAGGLRPEDVRPFVDFLRPDVDESLSSGAMPGAVEQFLLLERAFHVATNDRCLILWLDDVQWGWEALGLALHLLSGTGVEVPILVVLTVREDALDERPAEAGRLVELERSATTVRLDIEALPHLHRRSMVDALLGLQPQLGDRVEERTEGNPLFAVQLVGDWVHRGLLEPGEGGFQLRRGADAGAFPDSLHEIWLRRLERLTRDRPQTDLPALEVAAALGLQVARADWLVACNEAGANPSPGLLDALLSQRLARREGGAGSKDWAFVHGMLRESLERRAREAGRWAGHNRACAVMLEGRTGLRIPERLGRHLLSGRRVRAALAPLAEAARLRLSSGHYVLAARLLDERTAAMISAGIDESDPAWAVGWAQRARLERVSGDLDSALELAERAARLARTLGDPALEARALEEVARVVHVTGDPAGAATLLENACELADGADRRLAAQCRGALGDILVACGALDGAGVALRRALSDFDDLEDRIGASRCRLSLGRVARGQGRLPEARVWIRSAATLCEAVGSQIGSAQCLHDLGEIDRAGGDPVAAETHYREALTAFESIGSRDQVHCRINLGLCLLSLGRASEARDVLEHGLEECIERRLVTIQAAVHVFLLPCMAADDRWDDWDKHLRDAEELLAATSFFDVDVGLMARFAGEMALQAGLRTRAARVLDLSRRQWSTLGRVDEVARVDELLAR